MTDMDRLIHELKHRNGVRLMAELHCRLATELQLFEGEREPSKYLVTLALIDFLAAIAQMDHVPKALVLELLDACPEWEE